MAHAPQVLVVGAGLRGLFATRRLIAAGARVLLCDREQRAGGKAITVYSSCGSASSELGAMRVLDSHSKLLSFVQALGIQLSEHVGDNPEGFFSIGGLRGRLRNFNLTKLVEAALVATADVQASGLPSDAAFHIVLESAFGSVPISKRGQQLRDFFSASELSTRDAALRRIAAVVLQLRHGIDGPHLDSSVHEYMELMKVHSGKPSEFTLGINSLVERLCQELPTDTLKLGCLVQQIRDTGHGARVKFLENRIEHELDFDAVLLTCPALQKIRFHPPLGPGIQNAISKLLEKVIPALKMALLFRERFWEQPEHGGIAGGTSLVQSDALNIRYPRPGGTKGFILFYIVGRPVTPWTRRSQEERRETALQTIEHIHPDAPVRELFEGFYEQHWDEEGSAAYVLSEADELCTSFLTPHGRVFFSPVPRGWIEDCLLDLESCMDPLLHKLGLVTDNDKAR